MKKNKASLGNKIYRKIHWILYDRLHVGSKLNFIYPSYRHIKKKPKSNNIETLYLTHIPNEGAGIGHQISNFNDGVYCASLLGLKFVYPGFKDKRWEKFLGFGENEVSVADLKKNGYVLRTLPYFDETPKKLELVKKIILSYAGEKVIFKINLDQMYARQYDVIPYIKDKFEHASSRKNDSLIYNPDHINIAVHIRRGDIVVGQTTGEATLTKRWLTTEYFENIVKDLSDALNGEDNRFSNVPKLLDSKKGKAVDFYLFSQGDPSEYKSFEKYGNIHYCFDVPAMESFLHMVRSDILVTSKSSFSYKPALLADGVRICPKHFWHGYPDDEKWIVVDDD